MPYYTFKEIWTPFKFVGIYFFQEVHDRSIWIKIGNNRRKKLFGSQ